MSATLARILQHLPEDLQKIADGPTMIESLEGLCTESGPVHMNLETYLKHRKDIPAESVARLAIRTSDPKLMSHLAKERRISVKDSLALNPSLTLEAAETLVESTLANARGRASNMRWERLEGAIEAMLRLGEESAATTALRRIADHRSQDRSRAPMQPRMARSIASKLGEAACVSLIEDGTFEKLSSNTELRIIAPLVSGGTFGTAALLSAILAHKRMEGHYGSAGEETALKYDPGMAGMLLGMADLKEAGGALGVLYRLNRHVAAATHADIMSASTDETLEELYSGLEVDLPVVTSLVRHAGREGTTLQLGPADIRMICRMSEPYGGRCDLGTLLASGKTLEADAEALKTLRTQARSIGKDLLNLLLACTGEGEGVHIGAVVDNGWIKLDSSAAQAVVKAASGRHQGDRLQLAGELAAHAEKASQWSASAHKIVQLMHAALESRLVTFAELAASTGDQGTAMLAEIASGRSSMHRDPALSCPRATRGDLSLVPEDNLIAIAAEMISHPCVGRLAASVMRHPSMRRPQVLVPAALRAGRIGGLIAGELGADVDRESAEMLIARTWEGDRWDQGKAMQEIVLGVSRAAAEGVDVKQWLTLLAEKVPTKRLQPTSSYGAREAYAQVEALVLLHAAGDDASVWKIMMRLADRWEGTAAQLAEAALTLSSGEDG